VALLFNSLKKKENFFLKYFKGFLESTLFFNCGFIGLLLQYFIRLTIQINILAGNLFMLQDMSSLKPGTVWDLRQFSFMVIVL
jgi:hypothetical protein